MAPQPLTCEIVEVFVDHNDTLMPEDLQALTTSEIQATSSWRSQKARQEHLFTRARLRRYASAAFPEVAPGDWTFEREEGGKLYVSGPRLFSFNLSHTQGASAIALSGDPSLEVGVDIETIDRTTDIEALARRNFSDRERRWIAAGTPAQQTKRFFRIWTIREALLKCTGTGLRRPLTSFEVSPVDERLVFHDQTNGPFHIFTWEQDPWVISLVIRGTVEPPPVKLQYDPKKAKYTAKRSEDSGTRD